MPKTMSPPPTHAQLQAEACIRCGATNGEMKPAGHAYTPTGEGSAPLGWPVVACADGCRREGRR